MSAWPFPSRRTAVDRKAIELLALEREIAEKAARTDIELYARRAHSSYPRPVWDVSEPDPAEDRPGAAGDLARAVRYLDMRELLVRPLPKHPEFVSFAEVMP